MVGPNDVHLKLRRPSHDKPRGSVSHQTEGYGLLATGSRGKCNLEGSTTVEAVVGCHLPHSGPAGDISVVVSGMFLRPTRQATARCADDAGQALVARNELNEQLRPGALVLFPQLYQATRGAKAATKWAGKLLRRLPSEGDAAVEAEGLLMYTGAYIRQNLLDKKRMIHAALLVKDVLFVTNHVDISTIRGHASSMTGEPVRAATAAPSPADAGSKPS